MQMAQRLLSSLRRASWLAWCILAALCLALCGMYLSADGRPVPPPGPGLPGGELPAALERHGALVVPGVVDPDMCDSAARQLLQVAVQDPKRTTGNIHGGSRKGGAGRRVDLLLPREGISQVMYDRVLSRLGPLLGGYLGPKGHDLAEFSSFLVYPGAPAQPWHSDTDPLDLRAARLVSVAVVLDDVTESLAPLEVVLGSHTAPWKGLLGGSTASMVCPKGSVVIWDSRVRHRGSENLSKTRVRPVFYFSLVGRDGRRPKGSTYSLL